MRGRQKEGKHGRGMEKYEGRGSEQGSKGSARAGRREARRRQEGRRRAMRSSLSPPMSPSDNAHGALILWLVREKGRGVRDL